MITKENLRIKDSNFYDVPDFVEEPTKHIITDEDILDPGRITHLYGYKFDLWSIILRFNNIIDPFSDLEPGMVLLIPSRKDLREIELKE